VIYIIIGIWAGLLLIWASGYWTGRTSERDRAAARADLQAALDRQARAYQAPPPSYGPFPADTGPLLLLGEEAASLAALEREVHVMVAAAERQIPERWRS
jgi:type II secretory pathway pseudopilin PulG